MRRVWILGGFVLVAVIGASLSVQSTNAQPAAGGNDAAAHKKVTVSGTATIAVKPDTARVSFAVKAHGNDFKTASAECDKKAAAVEKAIKALEIGGLEIKKGPLNFTQTAGGFGPGFPGGPPPFPMGGPGGILPLVPMPANPPVVPMPGVLPGGAPGAIPPQVLPAPPAVPVPVPGVDVVAAQPAPAVQPMVAAQPGVAAPPMGIGGAPPVPIGPMPGIGWGGSFEVTRTFTVVATFGKEGGAGKLEDIVTVADKILTAAVTSGATDAPAFTTPAQNQFGGFGGGGLGGPGNPPVQRVEFYRANITALRQEAIKLAVADALANAKVAAGAANLTTKDIVSITDQMSPFGGGFGVGQAGNTGRGEVAGEQELTMTLSVTFSY